MYEQLVVADENALVTAAKAANIVAAMTIEVHPTNNPDLSHQFAFDKMVHSDIKVKEL